MEGKPLLLSHKCVVDHHPRHFIKIELHLYFRELFLGEKAILAHFLEKALG